MSRCLCPLRFAAMVAACLLVAMPQARAQSAADVATARELFKEAARLSKEGDWERARDLWRRSLALKPAPITHYSLAVAQKRTGRLVEALENFRAFLASPKDPQTDGYREPARAAASELEQQVGSALITIKPPGLGGLRVTVDGVVVPLAALSQPRLVNPGEHLLEASAPGFYRNSKPFTATARERVVVELELKNDPDYEPITPNTKTARDGADTGSGLTIPAVALMAAGGAVLGAGIAVGMVGLSEAKQATSSEGPEADGARTKGLVGDVLAGVGGAAAGVGLILLIVELSGDDQEPATRALRPWGHDGAVGVELRF